MSLKYCSTGGSSLIGVSQSRMRFIARIKRFDAESATGLEPWPGNPVAVSRNQNGAFSATSTPTIFTEPPSSRLSPPSVRRYSAFLNRSALLAIIQIEPSSFTSSSAVPRKITSRDNGGPSRLSRIIVIRCSKPSPFISSAPRP